MIDYRYYKTHSYRRWSENAKFCYNRGCVCKDCEIQENLETECVMKFAVLELVRKFGKPKEEEENELWLDN